MRVIAYIFLGMLVWACGASKKEIQKQETEKKTETVLNIKNDIQETVKTDIAITADAVTWILTPIDNAKPSSVTGPDGKTYTLNNAKAEIKKEKSQTAIKQEADKTDKSVIKEKNKSDEKQSSYSKQKENDGFKFPWWLWVILLGVIYGVLKYFRIIK